MAELAGKPEFCCRLEWLLGRVGVDASLPRAADRLADGKRRLQNRTVRALLWVLRAATCVSALAAVVLPESLASVPGIVFCVLFLAQLAIWGAASPRIRPFLGAMAEASQRVSACAAPVEAAAGEEFESEKLRELSGVAHHIAKHGKLVTKRHQFVGIAEMGCFRDLTKTSTDHFCDAPKMLLCGVHFAGDGKMVVCSAAHGITPLDIFVRNCVVRPHHALFKLCQCDSFFVAVVANIVNALFQRLCAGKNELHPVLLNGGDFSCIKSNHGFTPYSRLPLPGQRKTE